MQNHYKNTKFFYLTAHQNHYINQLKEYGIKIKELNLNTKYFGFRWWQLFTTKREFRKLGLEKFDLVIDLQSKIRNTLILRKIPTDNFYSSTYNFKFCSKRRNYISIQNVVDMTINNLSLFIDKRIKKIKYDINQIPEIYIKESKRLLPNNSYIGFSITQGNIYRKKSWPIKKFIEVANKIKLKGKTPVFFIEKDKLDLIDTIKSSVPSALFPEHNSKISCPALVTALSKRMDKVISIDNGIMHMISLANIPMIVLFGPTNSEKFSPSGDKIVILDSKNIYKSEDISKIGVEEVLRNI